MTRFLFFTTRDLHELLKKESKARGQTLSGLVRQILWEWVENQERKIS